MDFELFGEIAADTFLDQLESLSRATSGEKASSKHVVDYVSADERRALFDALLARCEETVEVDVEGEPFELRALELGDALVIPFYVERSGQPPFDESTNIGSSGFSCALRDFFAVGSEEPRALVTFTGRGNETQQSARETAVDRALLTLDTVCERLLERFGFAKDSRMTDLVDRYLTYASTRQWTPVLERLADFLEAVEGTEPSEWGRELGRLEVFMPDETQAPVSGERLELTGNERKYREDDECRLDDNAARREFLEETLNDPLERTRDQLEQEYEEETVDAILERGIGGEDGVTADEADTDLTIDEDTSFQWNDVEVEGAAHWERHSGGGDQFLVVAADGEFDVRVGLDREFDDEREYVHLIAWDRDNGRPTGLDDRAEALERDVTARVPVGGEFCIYKLALADGPRTYKLTNDEFFVVVSQADGSVDRVAWETGVELSFDHQAWVRQGETATFKMSDGETEESDSLEKDGTELIDDEPEPYDGALVERVSLGRLDEGQLPVRVAWVEEGMTESEQSLEMLAYAPYEGSNRDERDEFLAAMSPRRREGDGVAYLQAISDVSREGDDDWNVELSEQVRATVHRWNEHGQEEAVALLLAEPEVASLERDADGGFGRHPLELGEIAEDFLDVRRRLFEAILETSPAVLREEDTTRPVAVSIWLSDLTEHRELVERYLDEWLALADSVSDEPGGFGSTREQIYRMDTVEQRDADGELSRLTVLPTHPWLLNSLLRFQTKVGHLFAEASSSETLKATLTRDELEEFVPKRVLEDWYTGDNVHLVAEDATPFCMEFLPEESFEHSGRLDYVSRVVRNKIRRYLRMHDHLRDDRRTLRIAFVNPGDANALLEGIERWFKGYSGSGEDWLQEVPTFEVTLFEGDESEETVETAFDSFFREYLESAGEADDVEKAMLAKLRYRRRASDLPEGSDDFSHLCFARGLVGPEDRHPAPTELEEGWDGSFAGGAMATYLREPQKDEDEIAETRRGLWVQGTDPMRRGLSHMLQLLEGRRADYYKPGVGLFWRADLPSLEELSGLYDHSDWVVHLDRELNLAMFHTADDETRVIEYSDQEDPTQPGFDVITVTERAEPYFEQLRSVLKLVDLPRPSQETAVSSRPDRPETAMRALLEEINTLSGTWALDFLEGNVSEESSQQRLKGMVGASLVYRWLRRIEEPALEAEHGGELVPVYVSLEDLIRATPATGLPTGPGLVDRYGESSRYCDDLLALYLQAPPEDPDEPLQIYGRVIEVKFGRSATDDENRRKGLEQVQNSHDLMDEVMSGGDELLEAPIRHRQLSMLVKSQLEQAEARGLLDERQLEQLDLPRLSARLAGGNYEVSYSMNADKRHLRGDLFLLSTSTTAGVPADEPRVERQSGVRVVTLGRDLLRDLAHASDEESTLYGTLDSTLPSLGPPGRGPQEPATETAADGGATTEGGETGGNEFDADPESDAGGEVQTDWTFQSSQTVQQREDSAPSEPDQPFVSADTLDYEKLLARVHDQGIDSVENILTKIVRGGFDWEQYHAWMVDFTGIEQPPEGRYWGRDKILAHFSEIGFEERGDGVAFVGDEEGRATQPEECVEDEAGREIQSDDPDETRDETSTDTFQQVPALEETANTPIVSERPDRAEIQSVLDRLERVLESHNIELSEPPSVEEVEIGPRVMRVYIRPKMEVKLSSIENRSEDIALHVGIAGGSDIRIHSAPQKRAVALDLPIPDFSYKVDYQDIVEHESFESARADMTLGFCAGVKIDGTPEWVDLAGMPHMLVGGATGSGKTVFLNNLIMTLALQRSPSEVDLRLATSKAYDFAQFTALPHANDEVVQPTAGTRMLVDDLVTEMERRNELLTDAKAHKLDFYNEKVREGEVEGVELPHIVTVIDEYAATIKSFDDSSERKEFERGIARLAQEARATGIHLVLCMQRPDAEVVEGTVKSNITHRFALKLAAKVDSRVVLDQNGAETLLGDGDMLYLDQQSRLHRLQVPLLEGDVLRGFIERAG